jgi:hypothetical protein
MRLGVARSVGALALGTFLLPACGQSSRNGAGGGGGAAASPCPPSPREVQRADDLPAELEGTLCSESDALALSIPRQTDEPSRGIVQLHLHEGAGSYTVAVLASVDGELVPVPTSAGSSTFELRATAPDGYFTPYFLDFDDDRLTLSLSGARGRVALEVDRPLLAPYVTCDGEYEGLPVETPPLALPTTFELELCSGRDSRVWAVNVDAGRPVHVTLENPESIDSFPIGAVRDEISAYEPLMVVDGEAEANLGLAAQWQWSFTPAAAGVVAFYAGGGVSRGERSRLRIEQP